MVCNERPYDSIHPFLTLTGRGDGIVVSIGEQTEFGAIFATMQDVRAAPIKVLSLTADGFQLQIEEKRTPLQVSMDELGTRLSKLSFAIIGVICLFGVLQSRDWLDMFTIGGMLFLAQPYQMLAPYHSTCSLACCGCHP